MQGSLASRIFKRVLIAAVVVVTVVFALLVTVLSPERFRATVEQRLTTAFGRPAHIASMRYTIVRGFGVEASGVRIDEDATFGPGPFLEVDSVWADLGIWNALRGQGSIIESLEFDQPSLALVKREDGVWNWATLGAGGEPASTGGAQPPAAALALAGPVPAGLSRFASPDRVVLHSASISTLDQTAEPGAIYTYKDLQLDTSVDRSSAGYHVAGRLWGDSQSAGGEPLDVDAQFDVQLVPPGELGSWQATGSVPAARLATRNLRLDSVTTSIALESGRMMELNGLKASLYGGALEANVQIDMSSAGNRFTADSTLAGVSLADALAYREDLAGTIQGRLSATFRGSGTMGHLNTTLGSLVGSGHLDVADARLATAGVLQNLAARGGFQPGALADSGTTIRRVTSDFHIATGRATLDGAAIRGVGDCADMTAVGGWIDLRAPSSLSIDGRLTLLPSFFATLADANPGSATMLRAIGALPAVSVPVTVSGPVKSPSVGARWPSF